MFWNIIMLPLTPKRRKSKKKSRFDSRNGDINKFIKFYYR